jgi:putative ABC transport system permease protein
MSWKRRLAKIRTFFGRRIGDAELDEEVRAHLEMEEQENRDAGMSPEEAHYAALRKFGNVTRAEEDSRAAWTWNWLETGWQDVRFAIRLLIRDRAFTAIAVLSLAVGIGVNSALFSLADAILLRPLSVLHPGEVVSIVGNSRSEPLGNVSYRDYLDFRDHSKSFNGLVAYTLRSFGFAAKPGELPQKKSGMYVTGNFFSAMGIEPKLGRGIREDEDQVPGRDAVVVLGHDFWVSQLGADPSIVGKTVRLNGIDFTVTGVAPERFTGMDQLLRPAMYVPLSMAERLEGTPGKDLLEKRDDRELDMKGRLKLGTSVAQAQAELATIAASLAQEYPATNKDQGVTVMTELKVRIARDPPDAGFIAMLMAMAGVVLLVACANLASLQLSRARARTREIAIRLAIGAGRRRLLRQMMTESLILALAGGAASLPFAQAGTAFLRQFRIPSDLPFVLDIRLNERVLLFSLAITVLTAVLFGLAPAVQASATNLVPSLKSGDAEISGRQRLWGRKTLVIAQVSLSLVLMVMATVLFRAFHFLNVQGPGFRTDNLLMMSFNPRLVRYSDEQTQLFYKQLVERVRSAPGVKSAALTQVVPLSPEQNSENVVPEGYELPKGRDAVTVLLSFVDSSYFDTIGLPILRGRTFRESDTAGAPMVAVVNEELAKKYWPGSDPIGKRFRVKDDPSPWVEVVGVAKNGKYLWVGEPPTPYLYLPLSQHPQARMTLLVQSAAEPASLVAPLRGVVRSLDANQPIFNVRTMREAYQMRAAIILLLDEIVCAMGLVGLLLALVGLYGLMAYSVSQRTREIGIRMAIGANRASVVRMVLRQGLKLVLSGTAIGLAISFVAETGIDGVFNTTHRDPVAYLIVAPALLAVTMLAAWIPARRASRVDPMRALRCE